MTSEGAPPLDQLEAQAKAITGREHKTELGIVEGLLNNFLAAFNLMGPFTRAPDNDLQYAWLLLSARSFNSLRWAYELLKAAYYSQALILVRSASEDWLVGKDAKGNPDTLQGLLTGRPELGKERLTFTEMAKRIEPEYEDAWRNHYGENLSTIAHPRNRAVSILVDPDTKMLRVGPHYDRDLFIYTCDVLLKYLSLVLLEFLPTLLGGEAQRWIQQTWPHVKAAMDWQADIKKKVEAGEDV